MDFSMDSWRRLVRQSPYYGFDGTGVDNDGPVPIT